MITILGAGFGLSLAVLLKDKDVTVWMRSKEKIDDIRLHGESRKLLPGVAIDSKINFTTDLSVVQNSDIVIMAVPSSASEEIAQKIAPYLKSDAIVVTVSKGFCNGNRLSEVIAKYITKNDIVVLSGPSHAEEMGRNIPTTIVAACKNRASAEKIQDLMENTNLRVYVNDDIVGVELGGSLKNIIAVCAGILDGLGLGDNTKAALMTRGLAEISRLGIALGAKRETFLGLSGMGDLIVTCTSMHSRNRRCGILIGKGVSIEDAVKEIGTVEGICAVKQAYILSQKHNVEMPITQQLYLVVTENKPAKDALIDLMGRPQRHEEEKINL
ncbi:MAG: NAD(P)H-dependent glycerol-3-phosphate dehydrogenase [Oscillospiraceae bacterium]